MNTPVRLMEGCEIFETYIAPYEADLLQTILSVRRRIDQIAHKSARDDFFEYPEQPPIPAGIQNIQTYPHGYCREIRNSVLSSIQGLPYVRNFVAHG